ncbi:hypothetical protein A2662_00670 [Candidatus Giovannonibacteria bacterium RIFCSPHIGHO2_01_FULL_45_33]|uniref:PKD domain-containing protein n=1 Tax=Candidatus Giovannonibacteria bacterium RIFCSPLOWO2_01_FULL_45_34 TaxID=1798351 RepID=A0A1F5WYY8_9BACT|nr:MAG: hypothetical protein A2662_00670 [Candidatus Giovannonibacteria bacterium RIFCSPHIGHO2_01_FULL_45_33]OGF68876.1 MAG: hypothetical protein A3C73_02525 [Candidatus Giovannonibacteria bacterium RIFCSPHIGHO2_02_FULL_44_11]OGF80837.1 MAG: hypothetical protein A2930_00485 [Candidatus Giovannonibacteria bacterium RIFCSPLOWO2_01_FULL_45_34]
MIYNEQMKNVLKMGLFLSVFAALLGASHVYAMNLNFTASTYQISSGQEVILSWVTNSPVALHCLINDASGGGGYGSVKVSPKISINYTIVCQYGLSNGGNPDSATQTVSVSVNGVPYPTPASYYYPAPTPTPYYYSQPQYYYPTQTYTQTINVACATSPASPKTGESVTFAAAASGGVAPYTYEWSGAVSGDGQSINASFLASGSKTATVISKDALGHSAQSSCSINVTSGTVNASAPTPTPESASAVASNPEEETGKVEGASTICKQVTVCFDQNTGKITETGTLPSVSPTGKPAATTASSVSKDSSKSATSSLFASLFNIKGDVGGKIKSLVIWYVVILLVILLIVLSYMGIKKMKNKKEAAESDQQNRKA